MARTYPVCVEQAARSLIRYIGGFLAFCLEVVLTARFWLRKIRPRQQKKQMRLIVKMMQSREEVFRDMARVPEKYRIDFKGNPILEGRICYVKTGGKRILLSLRGVVKDSSAAIQIDSQTRDFLVLKEGKEADLNFSKPVGSVNFSGRGVLLNLHTGYRRVLVCCL